MIKMSGKEKMIVTPYEIKRICEPKPDIEQLVLKVVDNTESVYIRTLNKLKGAGLPVVKYHVRDVIKTYRWDLFIMLKYRQDWRPSGYGLGDLTYTTSLLPNEELTLEVKTWETDKRLEELEENVEEKNTSDLKTTSSGSSEVTNKVETKESEHVDAKAGYSGFGFSASVSAGWSQDVNTMNNNIAKQSRDRTQKASKEQRASQKTKMALSRESGSESKTTRKIKNINQAHTLNVNFYEMLKEYEVSLTMYEASLVLLGYEPLLRNTAHSEGGNGYALQTWGDNPKDITWGELIRNCQNSEWVQEYIDHWGYSPIKHLRAAWSLPLYEGALARKKPTLPLTKHERETFQNTMLQYVRPTPGWMEPDENGALRWAYEVIPGKEIELLKYLYKFIPFSPMQVVGVLLLQGISVKEAEDTVLRVEDKLLLDKASRTKTIRIEGPFNRMSFKKYETEVLPQWIQHIMNQFNMAKHNVGPIQVDGQPHYLITLPTQGVYADLALGICSGAEDYYAIQRQFDLELKKMEIEKLKLEVEKLSLENQILKQNKGVTSVLVKDPTDETSINIGLDLAKTSTEIEVKKTET
jgi:hypothetical protein